jgi:hypothetical protein
MAIKREPRNDLMRIKRALGAVNWDIEWLAEQVPALIAEIEYLRYELNEARNAPDLLLDSFDVSDIEELWYPHENQVATDDSP